MSFKKMYFLFCFLITFSFSFANNAWETKSQYFSYSSDVFFINQNIGWLVTGYSSIGNSYSGSILKTEDGGNTWIPQNTGIRPLLFAVHFIDENTGWVAGYRGMVMKTTDGGNSWIKQETNVSADLTDIYFVNENLGWAIGGKNTLLNTTDGGTTWQRHSLPVTNITLSTFFFIDDKEGWAAGNAGLILHTIDGGENWRVQSSDQMHFLNAIQFLDSENGFACGNYGGFYRTSNGGENWDIDTTDEQHHVDMHFFDTSNGILLEATNKILRTTDGGATWIPESFSFTTSDGSKINSQFRGLFFENNSLGFIFSNGPLLKSTDGGATWNYSCFHKDLINNKIIHAFDANTALLGGYRGIYKTTDGGYTWEQKVSRNSFYNEFNSFSFEGGTGYAVGFHYKIFHTTDNGDTWTYDSSDYYNGFTDVKHIDGTTYVSGNFGLILKSTGNGQWTKLDPGTEANILSIDFVNSMVGWAVGSQGTIIKTIDGGNSWAPQTFDIPGIYPQSSLKKVYFINENVGWILGLPYFELLYTEDGGTTWTLRKTGGYYGINELFDIQFINDQTGWLSGQGDLWKTNDGGISWERQMLPFYDKVESVSFLTPDNGWAITGLGVFTTSQGGSYFTLGEQTKRFAKNFDTGDLTSDDWDLDSSNQATWQLGNLSGKNFSSIYSGNVNSAIISPSANEQDELLMSPYIDLQTGETVVEFYIGYDPAYLDSASVEMHLNSGHGFYPFWKAYDDGQGWVWRRVQISLAEYSDYTGLRLAWSYKGANGGEVAIDGIKLYAANSIVTDADDETDQMLPEQYSLEQNYPNPFNPTTTIAFSLPEQTAVSLSVYNILGEKVAELLNNEIYSAGAHRINFNGANLASGVYLYRIKTDNFILSKKMLLIK